MRDVKNLTVAFLSTQGDPESFRYDLRAIAMKHGISDWQANETTYLGVGKGLREAGVDKNGMRLFKSYLGSARENVSRVVEQGYNS